MSYRYFKGNVLGGFRLSDVEKDVKQGQYIFLDEHVANTSRAVTAALKQKWMIEVTAEEATKPAPVAEVLAIPQQLPKVEQAPQDNSVIATPKIKAVNDKRMNQIQQEVKVAIPNFKDVEKKNKEKAEEIAKQPKEQIIAAPKKLAELKAAAKATADTVSALAKEESIIPGIDNSLLATPVFNKEAETTETIQDENQLKRRRRKTPPDVITVPDVS